MKNILFAMMISSYLFPGTLNFGFDLFSDNFMESPNSNFIINPEKEAVHFGYNYHISKNLDIGFSYMLSPMIWPEILDENGLWISEGKIGFTSVFLKPKKKLTDNIDAWIDVGISIPTEQSKNFENGLFYGAGINFKIDKKLGFSFAYLVNTTSFNYFSDDIPLYVFDFEFQRGAVFFTYEL